MSHPDNFPLGEVPLDSAQTIRKAWDNDKLAHRVVEVNFDWNIVEHSYNENGQITKVEYFYESEAESTKITFVADVEGNLDGQSFNMFTKDDEFIYTITYSVDGATSRPTNTGNYRNVLVEIQTNDPAEVIALATKQALVADSTASTYFTFAYSGKCLTITNTSKGDACDAIPKNTGFTFVVLQQGTKTSVETLYYTYDENGRIDTVTSESGENLLDVNGPFAHTVSIGGNGNVTRVTDNGELGVELAPNQNELLEKIVNELRIMNVHMSLITNNEIENKDLDTRDEL